MPLLNRPPKATTSAVNSLTDAYLALARDWSLWQASLDEVRRVLSKAISMALNAERCSIWTLSADGTVLDMDCLYTLTSDAHRSGTAADAFLTADYPAYFSALESSRVVAVSHAQTDPRTLAFTQDYLVPENIGALLDATLRAAGSAQGMICVEHVGDSRIWRPEEVDFVCSVADLFTQLLLHHETAKHALEIGELNALQRAILDSASYSIIGTDNDGVIVLFNKAAERMLGYASSDVVGRIAPVQLHDMAEISARAEELSRELNQPIRPGFEVFITMAMRHGIEERDWTYVRKDGSRFPVHLSITPVRNASGTQTGYLGIACDISQSRQSAQALKDAEHRYRTLFESASDAVVVGSLDTEELIITDCNRAALEMFRCQRADLIGLPAARIHPEYQPDGRLSRETVWAFICSTNGSPFEETFEWVHLRLDGTEIETDVTLKWLDINGEPCFLATVRDIGQRKSNELALLRSQQQLQERNRILDIINHLAERILSVHSEEAIGRLTLSALEEISGADYVSYSLVRNRHVERRIYLNRGIEFAPPAHIDEGWPTLSLEALANNRVQISTSICDDPRVDLIRLETFKQIATNNLICVPFSMHGEALGFASLTFKGAIPTQAPLMDVFTTISRMVVPALTNIRTIQSLKDQATHDSLTGLPNRQALREAFAALREAEPPTQPCALLLLDLDHFKEINDTLGHHVGDKVLQEIRPRLEDAMQSSRSLACRLGGDEFALLLPEVSTGETAMQIAQALTRSIRQPFSIDGVGLNIDTSIGISLYPENGSSIHDLLRAADVAMYEAKRTGVGCLLYTRSDDRHTPERLALMNDLTSAIPNGELRVHYQPKIAFGTQHVIGFEALARWQHPRQGLLSPARFMPLAEVSEIIHPFTEEILRLALDQQRRWRDEGHPFSVAVNLSARNLVDDRVIDTVERLLQAYGTPPQMLELEITETTLMTDPEGAARRLRRVAELGVRISIDDFGTGYSSLGYLRNLPIDTLKIDRSFIQELAHHAADATIVRSIISLAHNLGLSVVAEGIEDTHTQEILAAIGCDQAQGYHFSPPLPGEEVAAWLSRWTTSIASMSPGHALRREARRL